MSERSPVRTLGAEVARKIAAGEVIDRPQAIVRELMDNAIDSLATEINVEISGGGIDKVRVQDNGCGMTREDLAACARPHATSKIKSETDLLNLTTLGFRGEALASIAAVCRLSITSGGFKMRASVTEDHIIEAASPVCGTVVCAEGLFENFPARRQFLKRAASEALLCKNIFIEKTMCHPETAFTLTSDGERKMTLPKAESLKRRFAQAALSPNEESLLYELRGTSGEKDPDWTFTLVVGEPGLSRPNKKDIYIFVNGRRINEYSLAQAIEYGGQGYFPNGERPVAALFVTMRSDLVDFNIHPAKREARFKDTAALHHSVSATARAFFHQYTVKTMRENLDDDFALSPGGENLLKFDWSVRAPSPARQDAWKRDSQAPDGRPPRASRPSSQSFSLARSALGEEAAEEGANENDGERADAGGFKFLGSALGIFLVAQKGGSLFIIDKHAAHERILYNSIMRDQGRRQALLAPYVIESDSEGDDAYLESVSGSLAAAGFDMKKTGDGRWEVSSIPERWRGSEGDLREAVLARRLRPDEVISEIAAMSACKAAVKDGFVLDDGAAEKLAREALDLPDPRCPHGRPIWVELSRDALRGMVKRT